MLYSSIGTLHYAQNTYRLVLLVDQGLADYYRSLIPRWHDINRPKHEAHVTVVRSGKESPSNLWFWGKYEGEKVSFLYEPIVHIGRIYYWLNILCIRLEEIREELGLPVASIYTLPPDGYGRYFHCTIANSKLL
jgi:hypothetical protein